MCRHERKIETDGKRLAKGSTPRDSCPGEPFEELLDGPLPAGWSASIEGETVRFSDKFFKMIKSFFSAGR